MDYQWQFMRDSGSSRGNLSEHTYAGWYQVCQRVHPRHQTRPRHYDVTRRLNQLLWC